MYLKHKKHLASTVTHIAWGYSQPMSLLPRLLGGYAVSYVPRLQLRELDVPSE